MKWVIIKYDATKFIGHYITLLVVCESRIGTEDTLQRLLTCTRQNTETIKHSPSFMLGMF
jgi:hypothetical protein